MTTAFLDNLKSLKILKTKDMFSRNITETEISNSEITFKAKYSGNITSNIECENIFNPVLIDKRFGNNISTRYLPPVNSDDQPLGVYPQYVEPGFIQTLNEFEISIQQEAAKRNIKITSPSIALNILGQAFENDEATLRKLIIVNAGQFSDPQTGAMISQAYYIGKIFRDSNDIPKFLNIFTIVFKK